MIGGTVNARHEAILRLRVRGPGGTVSDVDMIVDTGFSSSLTLPATTIAALGLARQSGSGALLADGSIRRIDIYEAEVEWDGAWRIALISAIGNEALLGMGLLAGHKLMIEATPRGSVEVHPLP